MVARKTASVPGAKGAPDPRKELVGRWLGVPTSFFGVEIEGARYLARVKAPHRDKKGMLWMKFAQAGYGDEAYAPVAAVRKWLISDDEADDPKADWHEDPEDDSDTESESEEQPGAAPRRGGATRRPRESDEPRGTVKRGKWQPAQAPKTAHAVDSLVWRKASGAVPSHKPTVYARKLPEGVKEGVQQPLPRRGHGRSMAGASSSSRSEHERGRAGGRASGRVRAETGGREGGAGVTSL